MKKVFTISIIRDLNSMVKIGKITSSKMVEIMNEAVYFEACGNGRNYIMSVIDELKNK